MKGNSWYPTNWLKDNRCIALHAVHLEIAQSNRLLFSSIVTSKSMIYMIKMIMYKSILLNH